MDNSVREQVVILTDYWRTQIKSRSNKMLVSLILFTIVLSALSEIEVPGAFFSNIQSTIAIMDMRYSKSLNLMERFFDTLTIKSWFYS